MASPVAQQTNILVAFKAIPTLDNTTDTVQVGGTTDGQFHGSDATNLNVKPIMIGQGTKAQSVSIVPASDLPAFSTNSAEGTVTPGAAGSKSLLMGGQWNVTIPTLTDNQQSALQLDSRGRLKVNDGPERTAIINSEVTLATLVETPLLGPGNAGEFLDLITLVLSNSSSTAAQIDLRDTTGGSIVLSVFVPGSSTVTIPLSKFIPQTSAATTWTVKSSAALATVLVFAQAVRTKY